MLAVRPEGANHLRAPPHHHGSPAE